VQGVNAWSDTEYGTDLPSNVPACHGITFTSPDEAALRGQQEADSRAPADTTGPHDCRGSYAVLGYCVSKPVVDACAFNGTTGAGAAFLVGTGAALLSGGSLTLPEIGAALSTGGAAAVSEGAKDCVKGAGFKAVEQTAGRSVTTLDPAVACIGPATLGVAGSVVGQKAGGAVLDVRKLAGDGVKECLQRSVDLAHLNRNKDCFSRGVLLGAANLASNAVQSFEDPTKLVDGFFKNQIRDTGKITARGCADAVNGAPVIPDPFPPSGPFRMLGSPGQPRTPDPLGQPTADQPAFTVGQPALPGMSAAPFGQLHGLFETTPR
jgi:hypothetical protein